MTLPPPLLRILRRRRDIYLFAAYYAAFIFTLRRAAPSAAELTLPSAADYERAEPP